ncbi:hypothetical protein CsSME_00010028 [Camellia sinensis var. sinensis]
MWLTRASSATPAGWRVGWRRERASRLTKVCWITGCFGADILAGMDRAITDGVDVLSLCPSTIACRCLAIPSPERYLDSASPSARLICNIFSASAFSFAATLI